MLGGNDALMAQAIILAACGMGAVFLLLGLLVGCIALLPRLASATGAATVAADHATAARNAALAAALCHHRRLHSGETKR